MSLKVQNTLTGKKEEFKPISEGIVNMYVCGITPYDESHIGHARCYVVFDVIRRYLEYRDFKVKYIQNFTDIDDKIIARAKENGAEDLVKGVKELSQKFIDRYFDVMHRLNIKDADAYPRVTDNIDGIIELVKTLVEKEYAYVLDGSVYFSVEKFEPYGKLSGRKKEDLVAGARVDVNEEKKNPLDFALWKKSKLEEPGWDSPWGTGRPGWHIECSVMSMKYLGTDTLDIHGGGRDLIFPHHENEVAQSEAATGKEFCKYWLHNGFVTINEEKMSKSLGNTFSLADILDKYEPMVLRYFLLTQHYRSPIDFTDGKLAEAGKSLYKLKNTIDNAEALINNQPESGGSGLEHDSIKAAIKGFEESMEDDFNTAKAIGYIFKLSGEVNTEINKQEPSAGFISAGITRINNLLGILGIDLARVEVNKPLDVDEAEIEDLLKQRKEARNNKDWTKSDSIRDKLKEMGIVIEDTPSGARWKKQ